jgi:hypothetical protein
VSDLPPLTLPDDPREALLAIAEYLDAARTLEELAELADEARRVASFAT